METRGGVINNTAAQTQTEPLPPEEPMAQSTKSTSANLHVCTGKDIDDNDRVVLKTDGKLSVNCCQQSGILNTISSDCTVSQANRV